MKHLIKDTELVAYLEGELSKDEARQLKEKLRDNDELDLLYHLQLSNEKAMEEYANELIGEDDFHIESDESSTREFEFGNDSMIAANIIIPENDLPK